MGTDDRVTCGEHGPGRATYVCRHIAVGTARQFLANEPTEDDPWPDAWCERCEAVLEKHGGWNEESEAYAGVMLHCHHCYERRRRTIARPAQDLATGDPMLRFAFRCGACDAVHHGLPSWGAVAPQYYLEVDEVTRRRAKLTPDDCIVGEHQFIRGCLQIPILGSCERWSWGVWTSVSEKSFRRILELRDDPARELEPPYFGWLQTMLPLKLYPSTLGLESAVYEGAPGERPLVVLDPSDHPLAIDQRDGITLERAREIAILLLADMGGSAA